MTTRWLQGKRRLWWALAILALMATSATAWQWEVSGRMHRRYGATPGFLTITVVEPDGTACERIDNVYPKAHYNWKGEVWQDEQLYWHEIEIRATETDGTSRVFNHGQTGAILEGTLVCGFQQGMAYNWVYLPEDKIGVHICCYK